jgi:hypothetical protein
MKNTTNPTPGPTYTILHDGDNVWSTDDYEEAVACAVAQSMLVPGEDVDIYNEIGLLLQVVVTPRWF